MSLWIRWLSTTVPAATVAVPLGNDENVPGLTASTATADARVTPWRSSKATVEVAFSSAFSFTEAGAAASLMTEPLDPVMSAAATDAVEIASTALRPATKIFLECRRPLSLRAIG